MKLGEYKRLSNLCGIAKMEVDDNEMIIAYANYMDSPGEFGVVVGKGKTELEALRMAFINLSKNIEKISSEIFEFNENLDKLKMGDNPLNFDENPIIPIEGWEIIENTVIDNGKFYNAELIRGDDDGLLFLGMH